MARWEWDDSLEQRYLAVKAAGITATIEAELPGITALLGVVQPGETVASLQRAVDPTTGRERVQTDRGWVSIENRLGQMLLVPIDVELRSPPAEVGRMTRHSGALADRLKVADAAVRKMQDVEAQSPDDKGDVGHASRQRAIKMKAKREERRQSQTSKVRSSLGRPFAEPVEQSLRRVVHELRTHKSTATMFRKGDVDGSGALTAAELQMLLSQRIPHAHLNGTAVAELVAALDADGDGSISIQEFIAGVQQVKNRMAAADAEESSRSDGLQVRAEQSQVQTPAGHPRTPKLGGLTGHGAAPAADTAVAAGGSGHRPHGQKMSSSPIVGIRRGRTPVLPLTTESPRAPTGRAGARTTRMDVLGGLTSNASFDDAAIAENLSADRVLSVASRGGVRRDSESDWRRVLAAVQIQRCTRGHLTRVSVFSELSDIVSETLSRTQSQQSQSLYSEQSAPDWQSAASTPRWVREYGNDVSGHELEQLEAPHAHGEQYSRMTASSNFDDLLMHDDAEDYSYVQPDPEEWLEHEPEPGTEAVLQPEPEPERHPEWLEPEPEPEPERLSVPGPRVLPQSAPPVDNMTVGQLLEKVDQTAARFEATRALSRASRPQGDGGSYVDDDTTDSEEFENDDDDDALLVSLMQHIGMGAEAASVAATILSTQFGVGSVQQLSTLSAAELNAALSPPYRDLLSELLG